MADYLLPLPGGSAGGGAADSAATETVQPSDYNRLVGVLNGTAGAVGTKFFAANPPPLSGWFPAQNTDEVYKLRQFAGINADGATEDTSVINTAVSQLPKGAVLDGGGASYFVDQLIWADQVSFRNATLIKKSSGSNSMLNLTGTDSATTQALTSDCALGAAQVVVPDSSGFAVGDIVRVFDQTFKYGASGQNMEINRVLSIPDGTHVNLAVPTIGSYAAASTATITKLNAITRLRLGNGLMFINPLGSTGGHIKMDRCWGVDIAEGCTFVGADNSGAIMMTRSAGCRIILPKIYDGQNVTLSGRGYGLNIAESSHNGQIFGPYMENVRENHFTDNARHWVWTGGSVRGPASDGVDTHGSGCEHITVISLSVVGSGGNGLSVGFSGDNAGDNDIEFSDCDIVYCKGNGVLVDGVTNPKNHIKLSDIRVRGWAQGAGGGFSGIVIRNTNDFEISGAKLRGNANNFANPGINLITATRGQILMPHIRDIPNGFGIQWSSTCDSIDIVNPQLFNISSSKLKAVDGTSTNIRIFMPRADVNSVALQNTEKVFASDLGTNMGPQNQWLRADPVYGVTITPNSGAWQRVTVTDANAFTVAAPTVQPTSTSAAEMTIEISNTSGGVMGAITWNGTYTFAGLVWANPASTKKRFVTFKWNGTVWVAIAMSSADYA